VEEKWISKVFELAAAVAINRFPFDTEFELAMVEKYARNMGPTLRYQKRLG
jgi:formyltetrahydrofolate synthetase